MFMLIFFELLRGFFISFAVIKCLFIFDITVNFFEKLFCKLTVKLGQNKIDLSKLVVSCIYDIQ